MGSTEALVEIAQRVQVASLPVDVLTVAKHCVLDFLGVTLAGAREPTLRLLYEHVGSADRGTDASLLGLGARASLLNAALIHGTAAHALDYDDTHWGLQGHPTAPVLAAIWGLAEREGASGSAFLEALVTGIEVECRLGRWLNPHHYLRGFHATATLGAFGAAAAAAKLLALDDAAWLHAFGLAGTQAAGLKSAFGSMAKPLHVGRAAQNGLMAALLAKAGFTGCSDILDDAQGFAATHGEARAPLSAATANTGPAYEITETLFKYHAACHLTHATIEGLVALAQAQHFGAADVERVELYVDATCLGVCAIERPRTGMEAKFSLKATAAMALLGDATEDPRTFSDARAQAPEVRELMDKVHVHVKPMPATRTELTVRLRSGRTHEITHDSGIPEHDLARQGARLTRKVEQMLQLPPARQQALQTCLDAREQLPNMRELQRLAAATD
jgi:2-methylcitrate dehydratase PrpD